MNAQPPSSSDPAELPDPPPEAPARDFSAGGERASSVKAPPATIASHDEDLPFPLPADWFERKHAAAKAKADAVAAAAAAADAEAKAKAKATVETEAASPGGGAVVRSRPSAEMLRAVAAASSGEDRSKAFQANLLKGDQEAARGAWLEAATAYEVAARKAATPEQAAGVAAKAVAARATAARPRRMLAATLIAGALAGVGAGGWWLATHRPEAASSGPPPPPPVHLLSDDQAAGAGSLNERAKANAVLFSLAGEVKEGERPWSGMLLAAKAALALPGVNHEEAQALVTRIAGEVAALDKDVAAIEALRVSEPAKALALAQAFRTTRTRAGDYLARLPLPGRLLLVDCPPACTATIDGIAIDAKMAASATGLVFCRSAQRALTAAVSSPGYLDTSVVIPADSALIERRSQITMEEQPQWSLAAPPAAPSWVALMSAGEVSLMATPQLLQCISVGDGAPAPPTLVYHAGGAIPGLNERAWQWSAMLAGTTDGFLVANSAGALCTVARGAHGLHAELIARYEHPPATLAMMELVLRLNAKGVFTGSSPWEPKAAAFGTPKDEIAKMLGQCEVRMVSEGRSLWSMALEGNLPPDVFARGEQLIAIDDHALHVLDQEGKQLHEVALPSPRRGQAVVLGAGALVMVPTTTSVMQFHDAGGGDYQATPFGEGLTLIAGEGDDLAALSESALLFYHFSGGTLSERWSLPLGQDTAAERLSIHHGVICFFDASRKLLHLFRASDHQELHRLRLNDGVACAPLFLPDRVLVADLHGCLRAFPLVSPIPLGAAAP